MTSRLLSAALALVVVAYVGFSLWRFHSLEARLSALEISNSKLAGTELTESTMKTDLHDAAVAMETFYNHNDASYSGATPSALEAHGYHPTDGVQLRIVLATKGRYRLRVSSKGGSAGGWEFDSASGRTEAIR